MPGFCYILYSQKLDKYYVGSTTDMDRRLYEHNRGKEKFTRTGLPWFLCYTETLTDLKSARQRELYIKKKKSRKFIEALISSVKRASRFLIGSVIGLSAPEINSGQAVRITKAR